MTSLAMWSQGFRCDRFADMAVSTNKLLASVDFPVFVVEFIGPKHFFVGGGGGPSATGVPNGLEIFELTCSDNCKEFGAKSVCRFNSGKFAIMNCAMSADGPMVHLACGHDAKCFIYSVKQKMITQRPNSPDGQLRKRKSGLTKADDFKNAKKAMSFDVRHVESVVTDFHEEDAYQSCATFSSDGNLLATAGADGFVRTWKYPELSMMWEERAHEQEVDAVCINSTAKQLCSTSKDGKLVLRNVEGGKKVAELKWTTEPSIKYKHKTCRYCLVDGNPQKECLFSIEMPVANRKGAPCYISQWNINNHSPIHVQPVYMGSLACMEVSSCGKYLAVGSMEGEVAVFETSNLKRVYYVRGAHKTFVTGVAFAPSSMAAMIVTNHAAFTLVSISIDNQLKLHQPPAPTNFKSKLCLFLVLLFLSALLVMFAFGLAEDLVALPYIDRSDL